MKKIYSFKVTGLLILFALSIFSVSGQQTGRIAGKVTDKKTGETLIGLTVKVEGSAKGVSTDVEGRYNIGGLAAGRYTLVFSYVGYQAKKISDIVVKGGSVTTMDVVMEEPAGQQLQQVVINVSARQESLSALYAKQKTSARVSDGISAEVIKRSPDRNTGDVLKRVSGTTIQDNKFLVVRGLSDRYNSAMLDNASLPSTEPNRKAFSFDIVPSNLIDNVVVSKTATPDLPGDFAGGAVQISTTDIPDKDFVSFGIGYGYNSQSTFKDFQYSGRNFGNYLGFGYGSKKLPSGSGFPSNTAQTLRLSEPQSINAIKQLSSDWNVSSMSALPTQNFQLSMGKLHQYESGNRLGGILSLTYRNSQNIVPNQYRNYWEYKYNDRVNSFNTNIGVLGNFAYTSGKSKLTFKNIYNRTLDDKYTLRTGVNNSSKSDLVYHAFDMLQKSLFKTTLEGDHGIGDRNGKLNWNIAYSNIVNDQPDQKKISYQRLIGSDATFAAGNTSVNKENNRYFSKLNEDIYSGGVNFTLPVTMFKEKSSFKTGLGSQYRQRDFSARLLGLVIDPSYPDYNEVRERPLNSLFDNSLIDAGVYRLDEISNNSDTYDAHSLTSFAYAMLDNKLNEKIRVVWGVRAEKFDLKLNSATVTNEPLKVTQDYLDILPSINFTYGLTPASNLRLAYYRTVARPEFRELAPFAYYDYEALGTVTGNRNLKRTNIDNADFRYEIYPSVGEIVSFSLFYKRFQNAIEPSIYDVNSTPDYSYYNAVEANNFGAEVEIRKSLSFIKDDGFFKNTSLYANVSVIKSKVNNPTDQDYLEKERPMVGQSPYVINAGLNNSSFNNRLGLSLLYNRIGRRISRAGGIRFYSIYENPRDVIDFQAAYKVIRKRGEIKLNVSDLLNNSYLFYFDNSRNDKYDSNDEVFSKYKLGTSISLSFNYSF